jgi:putative tricarboxylic transport membrane protein
MEILNHLTEAFLGTLMPAGMLALLVGVLLGVLVGAMPGLSPSMGVALMVPFTYGMDAGTALTLLLAIYLAASYGGSITAITINTPGTASAVVTAFDGYPMTRSGEARRALGISLVISVAAGVLGTLILIFFSLPLAAVAVRFHPAEYFALSLFGLATVASLAGSAWAKAFAAAAFGLLLNAVGTDPISGVSRFTFGIPELSDGFPLIPVLIGLFALSEVFDAVAKKDFAPIPAGKLGGGWPKLAEYWQLRWTTLWSSIIGTVVGIFPGAGATIAAFLAYDFTKKLSKTPEKFGFGSREGIAAAESANSASVGGAMVPLLTLGIPGSATTAVLLGAMMIHKITPGPQLFLERPNVIYGIFASLLVANIVLLGVGFLGAKVWVRITEIPKQILFVMVAMMSIVGSFAVRNALVDVIFCLGFGLVGWWFKRSGVPVAPVVLGLVLGGIAETNFRRALMMDGWAVFASRPVALCLLILAAASFLLPLFLNKLPKKSDSAVNARN